MTPDAEGLTVKELVLRLDAKFDAYIHQHETRHSNLLPAAQLTRQLDDLDRTVESHERTIQRIIGALVLVSAVGIGTLVLLLLRISGVLPT